MLFATDIANFLACGHLPTLDRAEAAGEVRRPHFKDPGTELLIKLGLEHEQAYLRQLIEEGRDVVQIPLDIRWSEAAARTIDALRGGVDAVYQATFLDGQWGGRPDFLIRVEVPSDLGKWSYEVVETKLARSTKARAVIQLCFYSELLLRIQGTEPEWMHVVLGGGAKPEKLRVQRYTAYFRRVRREFEDACKAAGPTYPEPVEFCSVCSWFTVCDERRRDDDHLSLVAGISTSQRKALVERDVRTLAALGALTLPVVPRIERIGDAPLRNIREQARLQMEGRKRGRLVHELLEPVEPERGLAALPPPSPGDVFLDFEGDPYALEGGLEYLTGTVTLPEKPGAEPKYESLWSLDRGEEKRAFQKFIDGMMERLGRYPDMHIYHYAPYEPTAIKHLAGRHGICADEVDQLLRAGVFVDLFRVVRQGLRASVESYSIKKMEAFYGFVRTVSLQSATAALQAFETVLALGEDQSAIGKILQTIEAYNRDDCVSALRLRDWLESLRTGLETKTGTALPRPAPKSGAPSEGMAAHLEQVETIMASLTAGLSDDETEWTEEQRARWLLAQLLEWHRREEKSAWWEYFRLCELSDEELQEDKSALGGLVYIGPVGKVKRSVVHRYQFPAQDHAIDRAPKVRDPRTKKDAGDVVGIDERARTIDIKRGASSTIPHPTALIPFEIVDSKVMCASLLRLGSWVAENAISGPGPFQAARDLLLRQAPRVRVGRLQDLVGGQTELMEAAKSIACSLDNSVLPVQGPPGSGKTYTGARMIVQLVRSGRRVGITAGSHKVISNLLKAVCEAARDACVPLRAIQKPGGDGDGCVDPLVTCATSNEEVADALSASQTQVAAGTVWLWARIEMANSVDVLFVDEAGQMSLANVLAASQAAGSVVLLGDPQQLDQPQRGVHPPGADVSALGRLLGGDSTIGNDRGLFLAETWRLHPDVCAFTSELFYDKRLVSRPENQQQRLNARGPLDGTGLRFAPVHHAGNQSDSPQEVARVSDFVDQLLRNSATWTNKKGETLPLRLEDILVVAPYNLQVSALAQALPVGARVGTVDKFQGQEAPIVFYSMATSTPEDAPRGMEFLYSLNRLNVATSRAQCVTVLVASPALFQVQCKTPRQMELANAFCRYLEIAQSI